MMLSTARHIAQLTPQGINGHEDPGAQTKEQHERRGQHDERGRRERDPELAGDTGEDIERCRTPGVDQGANRPGAVDTGEVSRPRGR